MTRRMWLALVTAHLLGLAAIFGGDALLQTRAAGPSLAAAPANPFALARDEVPAAGEHVTIFILHGHVAMAAGVHRDPPAPRHPRPA